MTKAEIRKIAIENGYEARYSGKDGVWYFYKDGKQRLFRNTRKLDENELLNVLATKVWRFR